MRYGVRLEKEGEKGDGEGNERENQKEVCDEEGKRKVKGKKGGGP